MLPSVFVYVPVVSWRLPFESVITDFFEVRLIELMPASLRLRRVPSPFRIFIASKLVSEEFI